MSKDKVRCVDCDNGYFACRKEMSNYKSFCTIDNKMKNSAETRDCESFKLALDLRKAKHDI